MPRTTKTITFSLPPEMAERLDEVMQQQDRSRSEFLREAVLRYIEECEWRQVLQYGEERARTAIGECDVVIVLVGQDTHNAQGVIVETDMARSLNKHILQVRRKGRPYKGLIRLGEPIAWRWKNINKQLNEVVTRK